MRISYYETSWVQLWVTSFFQEVLLENELADSRNGSDPPLKTFPLKKEVELRFLHFKLVDFWGKGGGLQYFFVEPGEIVLLTIQALFDQSSGFRESEKFFLDSDCPNLGLTGATLRLANSCAIKRLDAQLLIGGTDQSQPPRHHQHHQVSEYIFTSVCPKRCALFFTSQCSTFLDFVAKVVCVFISHTTCKFIWV